MTQPGAGSLPAAVQSGLQGAGLASLSAGVQRLMTAYRSGEVPAAPVLASKRDVAAYAAYRMPATAAATGAAFRQLRRGLPGWCPSTVLDFGAGTGGAAWAVGDQLPASAQLTLLEQSDEAITLGRAILGQSESAALRGARWRSWRLNDGDGQGPVPENSDLATACYLLGELTDRQQEALVDLAARAAPVVLLVEPGSPAGHRRILAARSRLLARGYSVVAPCPHELDCPLAAAGDWCHFAARLQRTAVHRQIKGAELAYEDEKFSYVAAARISAESPGAPDLPDGRVVRRPQLRKNLVVLDLCRRDGSAGTLAIGKSKGETYRRARKTSWGDRWDKGPDAVQ